MRKAPTVRSKDMPWEKHSTVLLAAGGIILGRCVYRIIEYIQGATGELQTHEIYLYILDAGFMLVVMLIFHFCHPSEVRSLLTGGKVAKLLSVRTVGKHGAGVPLMDVEPRSGK